MDGEHVDGHPPVEQEGQQMRHVEQAWAEIDAGKGHHHVVVLDRDGTRLLSRRVVNTEPELIALIDSVITAVDELTWAIDLADGPAALLIALLMHREQHLSTCPGSRSTGPPPVIGARARPTPATRRSSPTRPACAATCVHCA